MRTMPLAFESAAVGISLEVNCLHGVMPGE